MDIIKAFQNNDLNIHIHILGTNDDPLFRASDIGEVLEISKIRNTIKDFDETEKVARLVGTRGGPQEVTFLTEKGLYKILFTSRKPIAKQFTNWVCEVIKEIRLNSKYELENQLKLKNEELKNTKEKTLLETYGNAQGVYLGVVESGIVKFGHGKIKDRVSVHKKELSPQFTLEYVIETQYDRELENLIKQKLKDKIISKKYPNRKETCTELIKIDTSFTIKDLYNEVIKLKDNIKDVVIKEISSENKILKEENLKLKEENLKLKSKDEIIKEEVKLQIIMNKKQPDDIKEKAIKDSWAIKRSEYRKTKEIETLEKIRNIFTITNDEKDILSCKEAHQIIINNDIDIDIAKITHFLDKLGVIKCYGPGKCRIFKCIKQV